MWMWGFVAKSKTYFIFWFPPTAGQKEERWANVWFHSAISWWIKLSLKQLMKATERQVAQITLLNLSFITEPIHCPNLRQLCISLVVGYSNGLFHRCVDCYKSWKMLKYWEYGVRYSHIKCFVAQGFKFDLAQIMVSFEECARVPKLDIDAKTQSPHAEMMGRCVL